MSDIPKKIQRRIAPVPPTPEFQQWVDRTCFSMWDGCACHRLKNHEGLHECGSAICDSTWTDEQSLRWLEEMRSEGNG